MQMHRLSRELTSKRLVLMVVKDQLGMATEDLEVFLRDDSGIHAKPLEGFEEMDPRQRIFHNTHRDLHGLLSGVSLDDMAARFVATFSGRLQVSTEVLEARGGGWTELPDLYAFLRDQMFFSAATALCGDYLFRVNPDFGREFWEFDSYIMTYFRRLPRWWTPKPYAVRDRVLSSMKRWRNHAAEQYEVRDVEHTKEQWEPIWGTKLMRSRELMFQEAGVSVDARSSSDLGLVWAANANTIPATLWALLTVFLTPGLEERVLTETSVCYDGGKQAFDIDALCSKPLLTSIYLEALRYSVSATAARSPIVPSIELGEWKFHRGSTIISSSWYGGRDPTFWNSGRVLPSGEPEHPLDSIWPERFLEYPDDPATGPVRNPDESVYRTAERKPRTIDDDKNAKVVTAGTQGHFYPYGGGSKICPGRFFAKQEMMSAVAVFLREFEVEFVDREVAVKAKPEMSYFPIGVLPPNRAIPVRIRRRKP